MKEEPVVIERTFNAPIERVWKAITDKDEMKKWYFDLSAFKPEGGFSFHFTGGDDNNLFKHVCRVTEVVPKKKLAYSWRYDGYEDNSIVTFELYENGNKTRLNLTHACRAGNISREQSGIRKREFCRRMDPYCGYGIERICGIELVSS